MQISTSIDPTRSPRPDLSVATVPLCQRNCHRTGTCGTVLRRSGRASDPALVEQILADVFGLPGVTDTNDGYARTFLSRIPLAQRVS
jgi:hypothetical protein